MSNSRSISSILLHVGISLLQAALPLTIASKKKAMLQTTLLLMFKLCDCFCTEIRILSAATRFKIDIYHLLLEISSHHFIYYQQGLFFNFFIKHQQGLFFGLSLITIKGQRESCRKIVLREIINMVTCFFLLPFRDICFIFMAIMHTKFCFGSTCFVSNCIAS